MVSERRKASKKAWAANNREKMRESARKHYHEIRKHRADFMAARAEYARWLRRLKKYGITKEAYYALMVAQNGKCAICGAECWLDLRVDHNHETGAVRGLLCAGCNSGIGLLKENLETLRGAIRYIEARK